ncbi:glycosyltransferase [Rhizobium lusitanum]|uniref:Glycosyltransferase involved in cell wall biosynthesis n=1 Tax=Rhizobium lusitanum TaxID=293958 RepID=A0A7X0MCP1_9HYPH|nr:glycosyltransferase [Rhizobium lusitanum]MBB6484163.1 glycosyltransferase involved in cell wall biosynthesis [Rhizobium lusitanum]
MDDLNLMKTVVHGGVIDQAQLAALETRVSEVVAQQQVLTDFQVEMVQLFKLLRTEQGRCFDALGDARHASVTPSRPLLPQGTAPVPLPTSNAARIHFFPDYGAANPYQPLIQVSFPDESTIGPGTIDQAIAALRAERGSVRRKHIFHLHWTNTIVAYAPNHAVAETLKDAFISKLRTFRSLGGFVIWTIHNALSHESPYLAVERALSTEIAACSDRIHLHSAGAIQVVQEEFPLPEDRIVILPHPNYVGVYQNFVSEATARARLGLAESDIVFSFIGMLRPYKGIQPLIEAFRLIRMKHPSIRLVIAGQPMPPYVPGTVAQMAGNVPGITLIERRLGDAELQWIFNASDFAVLPYSRILTSGSALNALSFSRPVIVPNLGVLPETVHDGVNGIVYDATTPAGLSKALERAVSLAADERQRMRQAAIESVAGLTWRRLAEGLYTGIAG